MIEDLLMSLAQRRHLRRVSLRPFLNRKNTLNIQYSIESIQ